MWPAPAVPRAFVDFGVTLAMSLDDMPRPVVSSARGAPQPSLWASARSCGSVYSSRRTRSSGIHLVGVYT